MSTNHSLGQSARQLQRLTTSQRGLRAVPFFSPSFQPPSIRNAVTILLSIIATAFAILFFLVSSLRSSRYSGCLLLLAKALLSPRAYLPTTWYLPVPSSRFGFIPVFSPSSSLHSTLLYRAISDTAIIAVVH